MRVLTSQTTGRRCLSVLTGASVPLRQYGPTEMLHSLREPFVARERSTPKVVLASEALDAVLHSGASVFVHGAAATPTPLLIAMDEVARKKNLTGIDVYDFPKKFTPFKYSPNHQELLND